jgi:hypothetical protein
VPITTDTRIILRATLNSLEKSCDARIRRLDAMIEEADTALQHLASKSGEASAARRDGRPDPA